MDWALAGSIIARVPIIAHSNLPGMCGLRLLVQRISKRPLLIFDWISWKSMFDLLSVQATMTQSLIRYYLRDTEGFRVPQM